MSLNVRIKKIDNTEIGIEIPFNFSILELKNIVHSKTNIIPSHQRLIYQGKFLKDNETLSDYSVIENGVIHLIENNFSEISRPQENQDLDSENEEDEEYVNEIIRSFTNRLLLRRIHRRFLFQQNLQALITKTHFNSKESLNVLMQNLYIQDILFKSKIPLIKFENSNQAKPFALKDAAFFVGQWVDVLDTIEQWHEAQIVKIEGGKGLIHYNGWGDRWDEWIKLDSPRIALFRTHTIQFASSKYYSPSPNIPTDSSIEIPLNSPNLNLIFKDIIEKIEIVKNMMCELEMIRSKEFSTENDEEVKEVNNQSKTLSSENIVSAQLAPIMDRLGRMLVDLSSHIAFLGKSSQIIDDSLTSNPRINQYQESLTNFNIDSQSEVPIIPNSGEVFVVTNITDRLMNYDNPFLELNISRDRQITTNNAETQSQEILKSEIATQTEILVDSQQVNFGIQTIPIPILTPIKLMKYIPNKIFPIKSKKQTNLTKSVEFSNTNFIPKQIKFNFSKKLKFAPKISNRNLTKEIQSLNCRTSEKSQNDTKKSKPIYYQVKDHNY